MSTPNSHKPIQVELTQLETIEQPSFHVAQPVPQGGVMASPSSSQFAARGADAKLPRRSSGLAENARIIMRKRYLRTKDDGELEEPEELFERVANAVAQGEREESREICAECFFERL
ncbi:MAG: hypothetical protein IH862_08500, partial [Chloroflexi bacterium]|nr:hypothetical protein [Chloroflexota bacterium]